MDEAIVIIMETVVLVLSAKVTNQKEKRGSTRTPLSCMLFYFLRHCMDLKTMYRK